MIQKEKRDSIEVLNLIYDSKGFPKEKVSVMDDEPLRKKLLNVVYHDEDPNERFVFENVKASDYYPKPLFLYDDDEKAILKRQCMVQAYSTRLFLHAKSASKTSKIFATLFSFIETISRTMNRKPYFHF